MWELSIVGIVGLTMLGAGLATDAVGLRVRLAFRAGVALAAVFVVASAALSLVAELDLEHSQKEARAGRYESALASARSAQRLAPWAASSDLQVALVFESAGNLTAAQENVDLAIQHDPGNWRAWLIAARLQTKAGNPTAAAASLRMVQRLRRGALALE